MVNNFERLKKELSQFPKKTLGFYPTPLQKLEKMSEKYGVSIFVKREDFSGMSIFGGNKIRKLEYLMGDACAKGCDTVFTYGATQSNHAMQTATAARRCGMNPVLYLAAIVEPKPEDIRANLLLDRILGAEIHIVPAAGGDLPEANSRSFELAAQQISELEKEGHKCYDIPLGGASTLGTCGFAEGFMETMEQMQAMGIRPDYIITATGTGGTLSGLVAGKKALESDIQIVGVTVSDKPEDYPAKIADMANRVLQLLKDPHQASQDDFMISRDYYAPGYEMPNEEANDAIRELARTEGLLCDSVYSGKALSGMLGMIRKGEIPPGSTVIFLHTGGATALFAEQEIIGSLTRP